MRRTAESAKWSDGWCTVGHCNLPPVFTQDMNNLALSEQTPVGTVVYKLEGYDPEGGNVSFGLIGSDNFIADPISGDVQVIKELDREVSRLIRISDINGGSNELLLVLKLDPCNFVTSMSSFGKGKARGLQWCGAVCKRWQK
uniref:Cadherin domain-containing protein n=1 Tax=Anopheles culicifacies TaxID=139723 RepID=A0A182LVT3_9DIPT